MSRTVALTDAQAALLDRLLAGRPDRDAVAAIDDALALLELSDAELAEAADPDWQAWATAEIARGEADAAASRVTTLRTAEDRRAFIRALGRQGGRRSASSR